MLAFDEEEVEEFRTQTAAGRYNLNSVEAWWKDKYELLDDHGYQLRPRLRPGWVPSWQGTNLNPLFCEDSSDICVSSKSLFAASNYSLPPKRQKVIDAVRKSDGNPVAIMNLPKDSIEAYIYRHLIDPERQAGVDHHIVPLLDSFDDAREPDLEFLVMPLLMTCDSPPFEIVLEIIDFFKQMLEVLSYYPVVCSFPMIRLL